MDRSRLRRAWLALGLLAAAGCGGQAPEPVSPGWADVEPIFRGECNGCHGWNTGQTGGGYRFDFSDTVSLEAACGLAAQAINPKKLVPSPISLAADPGVPKLIGMDVVAQAGQRWARMPPQPSPALTARDRDMLQRWAANPNPSGPPADNRPPSITVSNIPPSASAELDFTAVLDDPDGDPVLGVITVNNLGFFMNRSGSFAVSFDSSTWPAGPQTVAAVVCDGWTKVSVSSLGTVQIAH